MAKTVPPKLQNALANVCDRLEEHTRAVDSDPGDIARIIDAGNALRSAVLDYERTLRDETGWSNPIRHLGPLPSYRERQASEIDDSIDEHRERIRVTATYVVEVADEEMLRNLAEGRGADRPPDARTAVRFLFESDGWDVWQYPPERLRLVQVDLDVSNIR